MQKPPADHIAKREPVRQSTRESDFFFDELITAQPEATRDYLRARIADATRGAKPRA